MKKILLAIALLFLAGTAQAQPHWGTFSDGGTLYFYTGTIGTDGAAETPASEAIAVYKDNSATELTTGASIDDDFDGKVGFHQITIDTTQAGFDTGSLYTVMYTAGTVDAVSITGRVIGSFQLGVVQTGDNFARLGAPAGASVSADVAAAKVDTAAIKVKTDSLTFTSAGRVDSNVLYWNSAAIATPDTAGYPKVTIKNGAGAGELSLASGRVNLGAIFGSSGAATNLGSAFDGTTGYVPGAIAGIVDASIGAGVFSISSPSIITDNDFVGAKVILLNAAAKRREFTITATEQATQQITIDGAPTVANSDQFYIVHGGRTRMGSGDTSAITAAVMAGDSITADELAPNAIGASELAAGAITVSEAPNLDAAISSISAGTSPTILQTGTLTVTNQTTVVLSAGSADDDAYNNQLMIIVDQATSTQKATTPISDYVGGSKTATITAPIFTIATGDTFYIIAAPPATVSGTVNANLVQISGDTTAADNAELFFDGTGYAGTNNVIPTVTTLTNNPLETDGSGFGAGTTGFILHQYVDAAITSRMASFNLPANFNALGINVSGHISRVTLADTTTTYTGNTPQTGDAFARLATYRLGELMSANLASQPFSGSLLGDLTEDNAGTSRFTVAALFNAPAGGGGGGGLTEQQTVNSLLLAPVGIPAVGSPMASLLAIEANGVTIPELAAGLLANNVAGEDDVGAGGGFSSDERAQVLAALSITAETGVPKALTWTIARINGQMRARASIPKDASESVEVLADFRDVLADNDAIADAVDGGIVAIALINDTGSETVTSTAFGAPQNATVWMNAGIKFTIAGGTAGDTDRIRVTVLTTGGNTLSAPCTVVVSGEE